MITKLMVIHLDYLPGTREQSPWSFLKDLYVHVHVHVKIHTDRNVDIYVQMLIQTNAVYAYNQKSLCILEVFTR